MSWVSCRAADVTFGHSANRTALTDRRLIESPVNLSRMRSPSGRVACASRTASWRVGSTRGKLSPGTENDHGSPPDCFQIRACISFGSTLSAHAVIRVTRSMMLHSDQVELASRRQECGFPRSHRAQDVQPMRPSKRPSNRTPRARSPMTAVHSASRGFAGKEADVGTGQTSRSREIEGRARSWLVERPQRFCSTDDGAELYRTEVTAIEGGRLVPVHEEHFVLCNRSTALPDWQWATLPIMRARHAHRDSVDTDDELASAH